MTYIKLKNKKIAIIGGGISGLSASYLLTKNYNISLYEEKSDLGGHAITLQKKLAVNNSEKKNFFFDIGFLVYNDKNYPNFSKLLDDILVKTKKSNMSFSVSNKFSNFEYGSTGILSLTDNFKNLFSLDFCGILFNILKFYRKSKEFLLKENNDITLEEFLNKNQFNKSLIFNHIIPMCGAIWSTSTNKVLTMPAKNVLKFLYNHGLLNLFRRPEWKTISKGSENYIRKLEKSINGTIYKSEKVMKVERRNKKVYVHSKSFSKTYDKVIFAIHADDILKLLGKPSNREKEIFSKYSFEENVVLIHQDESLMPKNKNVWSSWNVIVNNQQDQINKEICVTYWINKLQNFHTKYPVLVTLNPPKKLEIKNEKILKKLKLKHPLLEKEHFLLSEKVKKLQGKNMTYYTGAWLGYGFHEDGLNSSINISKLLQND